MVFFHIFRLFIYLFYFFHFLLKDTCLAKYAFFSYLSFPFPLLIYFSDFSPAPISSLFYTKLSCELEVRGTHEWVSETDQLTTLKIVIFFSILLSLLELQIDIPAFNKSFSPTQRKPWRTGQDHEWDFLPKQQIVPSTKHLHFEDLLVRSRFTIKQNKPIAEYFESHHPRHKGTRQTTPLAIHCTHKKTSCLHNTTTAHNQT